MNEDIAPSPDEHAHSPPPRTQDQSPTEETCESSGARAARSNSNDMLAYAKLGLSLLALAVATFAWLGTLESARRDTLFQQQLSDLQARQKYARAGELAMQLDEALCRNHDLYPLFYENQELSPGDPRRYRAKAMAEHYVDAMDAIVMLGDLKDKGWERWMNDVFSGSPIVRGYLTDRRDWYQTGIGPVFDQWRKEQGNSTRDGG